MNATHDRIRERTRDLVAVEPEDQEVDALPRVFDGGNDGGNTGVRLNDELHDAGLRPGTTVLSNSLASLALRAT
ncbi:MAG TPA: hypothetical protein VKH42_16445, partial [Vicinamibacterales bacterium]|nr:hypothetical protein [Vicinamibacterales bacterium]